MELAWAVVMVTFLLTTAVMVLSHTYFMLAYTITNHLFPEGYLPAGDLRIPNHRAASYLGPKWGMSAGHIAHWTQYALAAVIAYWQGWWAGAVALAVPLVGVKVVMVVMGERQRVRQLTIELMRAYLTGRLQRRDFRWDGATNEEGEMFFEAIFTHALAWIRALPTAGTGATS